MTSAPTYTTSQLAEAASVGSQTLRYYERRGLLPEPPRTSGGHRIYGSRHLERLQFIQRVQCLGFHLEEIHRLLQVDEGVGSGTVDTTETLEHFIGRIDEKASALSEMRTTLAKLRDQAG